MGCMGGRSKTGMWVAVVIFLLALVPQGGSAQEGTKGKFVMTAGTGTFRLALEIAYMKPFMSETGIQIEATVGGENPLAQIRTQVASGNVLWDLLSCTTSLPITFPQIFEPVDRSIVTSTRDLVYPEALGERYVTLDVEANPVLAYSKGAFPTTAPSTWADFFDATKFPGPRGIASIGLQSATRIPAIALLADGVAIQDLTPLDLDRAYTKLNKLKPNIRVLWTGFNQSQDILRLGEVVMNTMTDGRVGQLIAANVPVGVSFKGAFRFSGAYCVPKGAPNRKNAFRFIEYILSHPDRQALFTKLTYYGPPTKSGVEMAQKIGVKDFTSLHLNELIPDSPKWEEYIQKNSDELLRRWNAWVQGF